jgi:hypothetical protein
MISLLLDGAKDRANQFLRVLLGILSCSIKGESYEKNN